MLSGQQSGGISVYPSYQLISETDKRLSLRTSMYFGTLFFFFSTQNHLGIFAGQIYTNLGKLDIGLLGGRGWLSILYSRCLVHMRDPMCLAGMTETKRGPCLETQV